MSVIRHIITLNTVKIKIKLPRSDLRSSTNRNLNNYTPNKSIPITPEMITRRIEENSFFFIRFQMIGMRIITDNTTGERQSNVKLIFFMLSMPKNTVRAIVTATERISPPSAGRILAINVLTGAYFK